MAWVSLPLAMSTMSFAPVCGSCRLRQGSPTLTITSNTPSPTPLAEHHDIPGQVYRCQPSCGHRVQHVGSLDEACQQTAAQRAARGLARPAVAQGKSHVPFVEGLDGRLYFATHIGYYSLVGGKETVGIPPQGWDSACHVSHCPPCCLPACLPACCTLTSCNTHPTPRQSTKVVTLWPWTQAMLGAREQQAKCLKTSAWSLTARAS